MTCVYIIYRPFQVLSYISTFIKMYQSTSSHRSNIAKLTHCFNFLKFNLYIYHCFNTHKQQSRRPKQQITIFRSQTISIKSLQIFFEFCSPCSGNYSGDRRPMSSHELLLHPLPPMSELGHGAICSECQHSDGTGDADDGFDAAPCIDHLNLRIQRELLAQDGERPAGAQGGRRRASSSGRTTARVRQELKADDGARPAGAQGGRRRASSSGRTTARIQRELKADDGARPAGAQGGRQRASSGVLARHRRDVHRERQAELRRGQEAVSLDLERRCGISIWNAGVVPGMELGNCHPFRTSAPSWAQPSAPSWARLLATSAEYSSQSYPGP
jgi:hypothetical protein